MFMLEHYEGLGIDVLDKEGDMKPLEQLNAEAEMKDLQARADAGLGK